MLCALRLALCGSEVKMQEAVFKSLTNGVYVVTVNANGESNGVTTPWVTQLSYEPPLVMVAISPVRKCHEMITNSGQFAVNVLGANQVELASRFGFTTGREVDKFEGISTQQTPATNPLLADAFAYIDCELVETLSVGDHSLFVGQVVGAELLDPAGAPLVFNPDDYF
jgi:flavin reductase (DIM6/NTAB) family NADH-FMN oxidoreductase RutF